MNRCRQDYQKRPRMPATDSSFDWWREAIRLVESVVFAIVTIAALYTGLCWLDVWWQYQP